jgi:hypothetical protein
LSHQLNWSQNKTLPKLLKIPLPIIKNWGILVLEVIMKTLIMILTLFICAPSYADGFKLNTMVGLGFRLDTSNSDYSSSYQNERNDKFVLTAKVYTFEVAATSESQWIFAGLGAVYQPPQEGDLVFSPVAYKDVHGLTYAIDLYKPDHYRGGLIGMSIGWSF